PRPRRQRAPGRSRELSAARTRCRTEIRAAGESGARFATQRCRGEGEAHNNPEWSNDAGDALRARSPRCQRHSGGPGHCRAVRRHDAYSARLERAGRWPWQPDPDEGVSMDAITIQILRNKVASLVDEMHYHFYRSGYSTIIRESRDFSCVILDREGRLIVAPPMFFHAPVYRHLVRRILEVYGGTNAIKDGDVFVSNHPYEGGLPHVSDMAFVAPVFAAGEIVAFAGSIAHKAEVGGAVAGSTSADATEMFQEGLLVPPLKIVDAGIAQTDVERIILANSRQAGLMRGDIQAQIAVTQMGAQRVKELCARFGADMVTEAFAAILKAAADELRAAVGRLPEGEFSADGLLDSDGVALGRPVKLAVTITIKDGIARFDFSNSDPQARGPVNLRPSMVEACVFYAFLGCLSPNLHFNDGMRDVVRLTYAPRTVTNAEPPAPVSNYQMVNLKLVDVILEALGPFHPARAIANAGSSSALTIAWAKGRPGQ